MPKYHSIGNQLYIEVQPPSWLFNSRTIREIYNREQALIVNINTGSVLLMERLKSSPVTLRPYYQPDRMKSIRLSEDFQMAALQIQDQFTIGNSIGKIWYTTKQGDRTYEKVWNLDYAISFLRRIYNS